MTTEGTGPASAWDHLQRAAMEMIAAARATLDTLDAVVAEPLRPGDILDRVAPLAGAFFDWVGTVAGPASGEQAAAGGHEAAGEGPGVAPRPTRGRKPVEHIPIR